MKIPADASQKEICGRHHLPACSASRYRLRPRACYSFQMDDEFPNLLLLQLSTLMADAPAGENWLHEIKYEGYRLICRRDGDRVDCFTRRGHQWSEKLPAIADSIRRLVANRLWLDGELVVMLKRETMETRGRQWRQGGDKGTLLIFSHSPSGTPKCQYIKNVPCSSSCEGGSATSGSAIPADVSVM